MQQTQQQTRKIIKKISGQKLQKTISLLIDDISYINETITEEYSLKHLDKYIKFYNFTSIGNNGNFKQIFEHIGNILKRIYENGSKYKFESINLNRDIVIELFPFLSFDILKSYPIFFDVFDEYVNFLLKSNFKNICNRIKKFKNTYRYIILLVLHIL